MAAMQRRYSHSLRLIICHVLMARAWLKHLFSNVLVSPLLCLSCIVPRKVWLVNRYIESPSAILI